MKIIHIRLPEDVVEMISTIMEGKNITDKVQNYIQSQYFTKEMLLAEKERCELKLKRIGKVLNNLSLYNLNVLTKEEIEHLKEALAVVDKNPHYVFGQKDTYNTKFNKKMSLAEFKLLLEEVRKKEKKSDIKAVEKKPKGG